MSTNSHNIRFRVHGKRRRGSILTMTAVLLPVLFILSAFCINIAYMQMTRTQLMVATDAAARSGGRSLSELQDVDLAKANALATAALNTVAGAPLRLELGDSENEIEFGSSAATNNGYGRYQFSKVDTSLVRSGASVANAVRITGKRNSGSLSGSVALPFPSFGLPSSWDVVQQAVATQVDRDIALVLDRSGSMSWKTYDWPSGHSPWNYTIYDLAVAEGLLYTSGGYYYYSSGVSSYDYQDWVWEEYYELGPAPNAPWDDLKLAVASFLSVLETTDQNELVSIASYASSATLDLQLEGDYQVVLDELDTLSPTGATAIGEGMEAGLPSLYETGFGRPFAAKTIIVMTDGMHNTGVDPVEVAEEVIDEYNLTIHTVTFSAGADQDRMQEVADIGGGSHYHADTGVELIDVFEEIANNLPTMVTQ